MRYLALQMKLIYQISLIHNTWIKTKKMKLPVLKKHYVQTVKPKESVKVKRWVAFILFISAFMAWRAWPNYAITSIDSKKISHHSLSHFEPPIHLVPKHTEKLHSTVCQKILEVSKKFNDRQTPLKPKEDIKTCLEDIVCTRVKNVSFYDDGLLLGHAHYDSAVRLLVAAVKWLHTLIAFNEMKNTEQVILLQNNWKELFILTAAQYTFCFDQGIY